MSKHVASPAGLGRWRIFWLLAMAILSAMVLLAPRIALGAEGGGEPEPSLFGGSVWTAIWSLAIFFILLAVLGKYAWKPVVRMLQEREEKISATLAESEKGRQEAMTLLEQYRRQLAESAAEAAKLMQKTQTEAEKVKQEIVTQARTEAEDARKRAVEQIEASKNEAIASLFGEAGNIGARIAGQILQREIKPEDHRVLIEQTVQQISKEQSQN